MKTILFGFVFLGLTSLTFAQNDIAAVNHDAANYNIPITVTNAKINLPYLSNDNLNDSAERIKLLRKKIADYNIKESKIYTPEDSVTYDVVLTEGANQIKVVYNNEGEIIHGEETFENIRLPYAISSKVAKDNPGWEFYSTWCFITYSKNKTFKVEYKIKLKKGNKSRMIKIID